MEKELKNKLEELYECHNVDTKRDYINTDEDQLYRTLISCCDICKGEYVELYCRSNYEGMIEICEDNDIPYYINYSYRDLTELYWIEDELTLEHLEVIYPIICALTEYPIFNDDNYWLLESEIHEEAIEFHIKETMGNVNSSLEKTFFKMFSDPKMIDNVYNSIYDLKLNEADLEFIENSIREELHIIKSHSEINNHQKVEKQIESYLFDYVADSLAEKQNLIKVLQ